MRRQLSFLACLLLPHLALAQPRDGFQPEPRSLFVEGYTDQVSYRPGETVQLHVSTSARQFSVRILRLGGEDRVVHENAAIEGSYHRIPANASSHGCGWPVSYRLEIPASWKSGYYHAELRVEDKGGEFVHRNRRTAEGSLFFIVRAAAPGKDTRILLQMCTNTYNAYTKWGGHSLYSYHARNKLQGSRVSFNRPQVTLFPRWEEHFIRWAETNGYTLDYASNCDLEFHPEILQHYRLVLSVGHDEYWSAPMRDHLEKYIADGGNAAFFSGNSVCWQVRSEESGRALTCWKQWYNLDPFYRVGDQKLLSTLWSHHLVDRPENQLTGVGFLWGGYHRSHGQFMDGEGSFKVHRPDHWIFAGTELKQGDRFGAKDTIVGYECDGCEFTLENGLPVPTHRDGTPESFVILATCPARWAPGDSFWYERFPTDRVGAAVLGTYTRGGTVVTTGTTDWAHGLSGGDPTVIRITRNILDRLSQ